MSLAPAISRRDFLQARLAVNGIQCAARSLGTLTAAGRGLLSSMGGLLMLWGGAEFATKLSASPRNGTANRLQYLRPFGRFEDRPDRLSGDQRSAAPIQKTSPSESSVSSQSSGNCGKAASTMSRPRPISHSSPP